jgi:hypothetical protein
MILNDRDYLIVNGSGCEAYVKYLPEEDDYDGSGKLYNITKQLYNENKRWFNKRNITLENFDFQESEYK